MAGGALAAVLLVGGSPHRRTQAEPATTSRLAAFVPAPHPRLSRPPRPGTEGVPILMYHVIGTPPPGAPFPTLYVSPAQFAAQMRALAAAGFRGVTLDQVEANWRHGARLPPGRPIVLTFD